MVKHGQVYNKQTHNASLTVVNMHRKSLQFCRICPLKKIYDCVNLYTDLKSCIQVARKKYKLKRNLNRKGKCRHKRKSRLKESKIKGN